MLRSKRKKITEIIADPLVRRKFTSVCHVFWSHCCDFNLQEPIHIFHVLGHSLVRAKVCSVGELKTGL